LTVVGQFRAVDPLTVSKKLAEEVAGVPAESVTFKVNLKVPVAVGVPETVPLGVPEVRERPAGRTDPEPRLQV